MNPIKEVRTRSARAGLAVLVGSLMIFLPSVAMATISQSYGSTSQLTPGMLASAIPGKNEVVAADTENTANLIGVVVAQNDATLAVGSSGVQIATSGTANTFVSDINGPVKVGDYITASPIKGVGMRAASGSKIVGIAQADASTTATKSVAITDKDGKKTEAHVTSVPVTVQPGTFTPPSQQSDSAIPEPLQLFANSIAGKPVAVLRVVISGVIVLIALIISTLVVTSAMRSTMVSLGRNPLARASIYRGLWQVIITAMLIMVAALVGAFVVLTR